MGRDQPPEMGNLPKPGQDHNLQGVRWWRHCRLFN